MEDIPALPLLHVAHKLMRDSDYIRQDILQLNVELAYARLQDRMPAAANSAWQLPIGIRVQICPTYSSPNTHRQLRLLERMQDASRTNCTSFRSRPTYGVPGDRQRAMRVDQEIRCSF